MYGTITAFRTFCRQRLIVLLPSRKFFSMKFTVKLVPQAILGELCGFAESLGLHHHLWDSVVQNY